MKNYFNTLYLAIPNYDLGRHDSGMVVPDYGVYVLAFTIVIMLIVALGKNGLGGEKVVDAFVNGASSLVGVSLIIGLARGINRIMNDGLISDTVLNFFIITCKTCEWTTVYSCIIDYLFLPRIYYSFIIRIGCTCHANICTTC